MLTQGNSMGDLGKGREAVTLSCRSWGGFCEIMSILLLREKSCLTAEYILGRYRWKRRSGRRHG